MTEAKNPHIISLENFRNLLVKRRRDIATAGMPSGGRVLLDVQNEIDAIDRAIDDEKKLAESSSFWEKT